MSVQHNIYLMYGMQVSLDIFPKDELDEYDLEWGSSSSYSTKVEHKDGLFLLSDNMAGRYNVIGRVLGKMSDDEDCSFEDCQEVESMAREEVKLEVEESIKRNFDIEPNCKLYLINHYS